MTEVASKFNKDQLKALVKNADNCVKLVKGGKLVISIHPSGLGNVTESVKNVLNDKITKYDVKLDGILLNYQKLKILPASGNIIHDLGMIQVHVQADFFIFTPAIGRVIQAMVTKKSADHVGCLVHKLFNVSIPKPTDLAKEEWCGRFVKIGQTVLVEITLVDCHYTIPYIRGNFVESSITHEDGEIPDDEPKPSSETKKKKKRKNKHYDMNIVNDEAAEHLKIFHTPKEKKSVSFSKSNQIKTIDALDDFMFTDDNRTVEDKSKINFNTNDSVKKKRKRSIEMESGVETPRKKSKSNEKSGEGSDLNRSNISESFENDSLKKKKRKREKRLDAEEIPVDDGNDFNDLLKKTLNDSPSKKKKSKNKNRSEFEDIPVVAGNDFNNSLDNPPTDTFDSSSKKSKKSKKNRSKSEDIPADDGNDFNNSLENPLPDTFDSSPKKKDRKREKQSENIPENDFNNLLEKTLSEALSSSRNDSTTKKRKQENRSVTLDGDDFNDLLEKTVSEALNSSSKKDRKRKRLESKEIGSSLIQNGYVDPSKSNKREEFPSSLVDEIISEGLSSIKPDSSKKKRNSKQPNVSIDQLINESLNDLELTSEKKRKNKSKSEDIDIENISSKLLEEVFSDQSNRETFKKSNEKTRNDTSKKSTKSPKPLPNKPDVTFEDLIAETLRTLSPSNEPVKLKKNTSVNTLLERTKSDLFGDEKKSKSSKKKHVQETSEMDAGFNCSQFGTPLLSSTILPSGSNASTPVVRKMKKEKRQSKTKWDDLNKPSDVDVDIMKLLSDVV